MGIGGEYSAINSAIDEMMPARYRGRTDIWINGSYWLGAILGTLAAFLLLNSLRPNAGWRVGFLAGPVLAFVILFVRRNLPESPRWLLTHGREQEAEAAMRRIEEAAINDGQHLAAGAGSAAITILPEKGYGYLTLLRVAFRQATPAGGPRRHADDHPVVPVQRDLLHLRPGADEVLPRHQQRGPGLRAGVRGRQPGRPAAARPPVRHPRAGRR